MNAWGIPSKETNLKVKKNELVWLIKVFREAVSQDRVHVGSAEIRTLIFLQIRISGLGYMQYFPESSSVIIRHTQPQLNLKNYFKLIDNKTKRDFHSSP